MAIDSPLSTENPTSEQISKATQELVDSACSVFDSPSVRNTLIDIRKRNEQIIDNVSQDTVTFAGFDETAKEKARSVVDSFKKFIEENKDELTALQIIYSKPHGTRHVTDKQIKELAAAIQKPPYNLNSDLVWQAFL